MYLSRLKLNQYHRTTRELRLNSYLLHQAVFRAFPDIGNGGPGRVLYRLEISRNGQTSLLVQCEKRPEWEKADFLRACLNSPPECREFSPALRAGQRLYFRLRANPVAKRATPDKPDVTRRFGLVKEEDQLRWLERKGENGGFSIVSCTVFKEGKIMDKSLTHFAVRFEGVLEVADPDKFQDVLRSGIGPAKGFGFGLLSVAPIRS